ncbi:hypothetical protein E4U14_000524 [Claviceps sp. LM454 group G7]|nr:hypothetical protein E4U14_000524 [Claviceps sp. LM454 group G7]
MSSNGKPSARVSSSRTASQPATHEQPNVPQLPDVISLQDNAPVTMAVFLQQLATQVQASAIQVQASAIQVQASATQVQSVVQAFHSVREETAELRRLVLTLQEDRSPVVYESPSAHFARPARFSGNDLTVFRAWWASVICYLDGNLSTLNTDRTIISWVSSHFTETALEWHRAKICNGDLDLDSPTLWLNYSDALIKRFSFRGSRRQ